MHVSFWDGHMEPDGGRILEYLDIPILVRGRSFSVTKSILDESEHRPETVDVVLDNFPWRCVLHVNHGISLACIHSGLARKDQLSSAHHTLVYVPPLSRNSISKLNKVLRYFHNHELHVTKHVPCRAFDVV